MEKLTNKDAVALIKKDIDFMAYILTVQKELLYSPCKILPLEDLKGVIVGVAINKHGIEFQVRYFIDGEYRIEWFHFFDIEVCND